MRFVNCSVIARSSIGITQSRRVIGDVLLRPDRLIHSSSSHLLAPPRYKLDSSQFIELPIAMDVSGFQFWMELPEEIAISIFCFLPIRDLLMLSETSKGTKELVERESVWRELYFSTWETGEWGNLSSDLLLSSFSFHQAVEIHDFAVRLRNFFKRQHLRMLLFWEIVKVANVTLRSISPQVTYHQTSGRFRCRDNASLR